MPGPWNSWGESQWENVLLLQFLLHYTPPLLSSFSWCLNTTCSYFVELSCTLLLDHAYFVDECRIWYRSVHLLLTSPAAALHFLLLLIVISHYKYLTIYNRMELFSVDFYNLEVMVIGLKLPWYDPVAFVFVIHRKALSLRNLKGESTSGGKLSRRSYRQRRRGQSLTSIAMALRWVVRDHSWWSITYWHMKKLRGRRGLP